MVGRNGQRPHADGVAWWLVALLLVLASFTTSLAQAQGMPGVAGAIDAPDEAAALLDQSGALTPEAATALVARLSDAQVRELLLAQLAAEAERQAGAAAEPGMIVAVTG
jgi:hypothetical protein